MYSFTEPTHEALFALLGMPVYPYALAVALGALIALCMASLRAHRTGISVSPVFTFAMLSLPICLLFARFAFCACRIVDVLDFGIGYIFHLEYGGFSIIGATFGMLLSAWIVKRTHRISFACLMDTVLPGLLVMLAVCRLAEGSTMNGTGPEIKIEALQFMPLSRLGLYGEMTYAVYMGEALTALVVGVMTQAMSSHPHGLSAGTGAIIVCAAQIVWESARRDEVLIISFVRYTMVFSALVLLALLIVCLHSSKATLRRWTNYICVFMFGVIVIGVCEFLIDGKIWQNMPIWLCYLLDIFSIIIMAVVCLRALRTACEQRR